MGNLDSYEIRDEISSGAYGTVFRAWQPAVGREVAIKVIRPEHASEPEFVERFEAEAQMVARLEHPTIVPVHDYWRDDTGAYLVMRLLGGGSLKDRLRDGALPVEDVLDLADDICNALAAAHDQGVVHRDLKPANILFDERGNAYLSDFGIAKNLAAEVKLTQTGAILGTPDYISPEQIRGEELTAAADQYSLGIVLFEALTGRVPYPGLSVAALFQKHLMEPLPPLASVNPELPAEFDAVLQRATAKEPGERYPGIMGLAEALGQAASFQPSAVSRQPSDVSHLPAFLEEGDGAERERPVFVGRQAELEWSKERLRLAVDGQGQIAFIAGDAGEGKSSLMSTLAAQASEAEPELLVAWGSCNAFSGSGDPYLPFRDIFATLAGDVESRWATGSLTQDQARALWEAIPDSAESVLDHGPDLIDTLVPATGLTTFATVALPAGSPTFQKVRQRTATSSGASSELEQPQLFEQVLAVLREISERRPLLLLLDDLQWADSGSINLLFHLGRRLAGTRILLLGAYRQDELTAGTGDKRHPLTPLLDEFKGAYGDIFLDLSQEQERSFVDDLIDSEPNQLDDSFRQTLFSHTGGHPLFTVELLRDLQERGALRRDADGRWVQSEELDWSALPPRVEGVIEARIGRLEEELRDILSVAAVEGVDFTAQIVARVQEIQERRLLRTLSRELDRRHRLVKEGAADAFNGQSLVRYSFAHALFQQYLYNDLGSAERRLLHSEIAQFLEELYAGRLEKMTVQLAWHYTEAGEVDKALPFLLQAGDSARNLYVLKEAARHYQKALAIYKDQGDYESASRILMKLGLTFHNAFDYERAHEAYEEAFRLRTRGVLATQPAQRRPAPHALRLIRDHLVTLDPGRHNDGDTGDILGQLFSGLVDLTPELDVVPDIASSWEILDGGGSYVFHLRDDVSWSDGEPVTAHDFVLAWRRALDPAGGSPAASYLYDIRGASELHSGRGVSFDDLGVRAADDRTLTVVLDQPSSIFLYILHHDVTRPVPAHVIAAHGDAWIESDKFVSCGPFLIKAYPDEESIVLERNPAYHGDFRGNVDSIEVRFVMGSQAKADTLLTGYEKDEYDILALNSLLVGRQEAIRRNPDGLIARWNLSTLYVSFDVSRPPFDDLQVRQAFVMATDRQTLAAVGEMGTWSPATGGFIPLGMPGHVHGIGLPFDLKQARQLLAEAGYPGGHGFPQTTALTFHGGESFIEPVFESWRSSLGVEISLEVLEWSAFLRRIQGKANRPHIFLFGWGADYPDPDSMMRLGRKTASNWNEDTYDALVEQARQVMDQDERMRLYRQAEEILVREAPFFPLYYGGEFLLVKPWVRNYFAPLVGAPDWKDVIIDPH